MKKILSFLLFFSTVLSSFGLWAANKTSVTTSTFAAALTAAANGDTLLLSAGTYPQFTFQNGKTLVLKSANAGSVKIGALSTAGTSVTGCGFVFDGVTIDTGAGSSNFSGGDVGNITKLSFINDTIQNVGRCIFTNSTGGFTVDSVVFKRTIIKDCGAGRYNLFWQAHAIKNFLMRNCTLKNYTNGENILCPRSAATSNVLNFTFENNTVYNWSKTGYFLVNTGSSYNSASTYTFRNNIIAEPSTFSGTVPGMINATGGTLVAQNNLIVNFGSYTMTTPVSSTINDLTLAGLGITSIPFANPTNGDFSITSNSTLATASTTGGLIGDPRWLKTVSTPRQLTLVANPSNAGTLTPGSGTYNDGDQVTVSATRNFGFQFKEWQDANTSAVLSTANPYIFNITSDISLKAVFNTLATYDYTVTTTTGGTVALSPLPTSNKYEEGTTVTATATKNFGYKFVEWRDANADTLISKTNPYVLAVNKNIALKPVFAAVNTYSLTSTVSGGAAAYMVSASPAGTVVNGQTMYEEGTNVTLTAANNTILTFANWSTGETSASLSFTMNQNKSFNAVYNAVDYIAGWDFYNTGGQSRIADFYSNAENATDALLLRKADGTLNSWLDKSVVAAAGYYGRGAAVKWKNLTDKYYYQISFDASAFKTIVVKSAMLVNYNAYSKQIIQYSTDNSTFNTLDTIKITSGQTWFDKTVTLPSSVDYAPKVYVRWIPDYTSSLLGSASDLDGAGIASIYVLGSNVPPPDAVPPVLQSTIPAASATNASTTGNIVLNFDEKVALTSLATITFNGKQLTPTVTGKTITLPYTGLQYNTQYTFTLPANLVADLYNNVLTLPVSVTFTTMNRPIVTKKSFDFVVGVDGDFKAALAAATAVSSNGNRFRIFFPNGQYNIGENTGDANQQTTISLANVSYVGQSADNVVLYNKNTAEGMGVTPTINFTSTANNLYLQDLSLKNSDYRSGVPSIGRCLALYDNGTKNIFKNVNLLSNQDTYFSAVGRKYFEGGSIHGTVDYIFGGGDVFFNGCLLYMEGSGYVTAPNHTASTQWGYVFRDCTIDGVASTNGNYNLGRPWQNSPRSVFINTTMKVLPAAQGWSDWYTAPALFAEYNSATSAGTPVDLTMRRTTYQSTVVVNPVLTAEQAATYTVDNVFGGSDAWNPRIYTDQAAAPVISSNGNIINWEDNNYVLCWAVFKDNVFVKFTTSNSYTIPSTVTSGSYTVRAANEMGGLSTSSNTISYIMTSVEKPLSNNDISIISNSTDKTIKVGFTLDRTSNVGLSLYNVDGKQILSGVETSYNAGKQTVELSQAKLNAGVYVLKVKINNNLLSKKIIVL